MVHSHRSYAGCLLCKELGILESAHGGADGGPQRPLVGPSLGEQGLEGTQRIASASKLQQRLSTTKEGISMARSRAQRRLEGLESKNCFAQ